MKWRAISSLATRSRCATLSFARRPATPSAWKSNAKSFPAAKTPRPQRFHRRYNFAQRSYACAKRAPRIFFLHGASRLSHLPGQRLESRRAHRQKARRRWPPTSPARPLANRKWSGRFRAIARRATAPDARSRARGCPSAIATAISKITKPTTISRMSHREQLAAWNRSLDTGEAGRAAFRRGILPSVKCKASTACC